MQFDICAVINDYPTKKEYVALYGKTHTAQLATKRAKWVFLRTRLAEAQNWKCCYCGRKMTEVQGRGDSVTTEHVIPRSKGGSDTYENLVAACGSCNSKRNNMPLETMLACVAKGFPLNHEQRRKHKLMKERVRHYVKRANKFAENGYPSGITFEQWFSTLKLNAEGKRMFWDQYNREKQ